LLALAGRTPVRTLDALQTACLLCWAMRMAAEVAKALARKVGRGT